MSKIIKILLLLIISLSVLSCETEITFTDTEVDKKLVINSIAKANTQLNTIEVTESLPIFSITENNISEAPIPLLNINRQKTDLKEVTNAINIIRYSFDETLSAGDIVEYYSSSKKYGELYASDTVPQQATISNVETSWFEIRNNKLLRTIITLNDIPNEDNYYRLVVYSRHTSTANPNGGTWERKDVYTDEDPIFSQIPITIYDESKLSFRIFTDLTFANSNYKLNVYFKDYSNFAASDLHFVKIEIQSLSAALYKYYQSLELQNSQDYYLEPVKIYSNVNGGYGIIGAYNSSEKIIEIE